MSDIDNHESPVARLSRLAEAVYAHLRHRGDQSHVIYQISTITALLAGVYDGDVTIGELLTHGDFGLGTFNSLDGEMVVIDGTCYHLRSDGTAAVADDEERTPFAVVTRFRPQTSFTIDRRTSRSEFGELVATRIESPNLMYAVRIEGRFSGLRTRTVACQHRPYPPLTEATKGQAEASYSDIDGTLAGFLTPGYEREIGVAGYHLHFLDRGRVLGGHALGFEIDRATVAIDMASELHLSLPTEGPFISAAIASGSVDDQVRQAEGGSQGRAGGVEQQRRRRPSE